MISAVLFGESMAAASRFSASAWKRELDDDTVEYFIFPKLSCYSSKAEATQLLKDFRDSCMSVVQSDLELYIWQNEPFVLNVPHESGFQLVQDNRDKKHLLSSETSKGRPSNSQGRLAEYIVYSQSRCHTLPLALPESGSTKFQSGTPWSF